MFKVLFISPFNLHSITGSECYIHALSNSKLNKVEKIRFSCQAVAVWQTRKFPTQYQLFILSCFTAHRFGFLVPLICSSTPAKAS